MIWERLVIDGNTVYEIDEECVKRRKEQEERRMRKRPCGRGGVFRGQDRERA